MPMTMLGNGLYDAAEVGRLLGHDVQWVIRWSTRSSAGDAIVPPSFDRAFSFADLVSFRVGLLIRNQGVSDRHLRRGVETLRAQTGLAKPLASHDVIESLATSGTSFLSTCASGDYEDIGQGRQGVFQSVVRIHLTRVTFGAHGDPARWTPADGITIDPAVQAGAPCIAGTRVPTRTVAALLTEVQPEDVALDFDVTVAAVLQAASFEGQLDDGVGLAA